QNGIRARFSLLSFLNARRPTPDARRNAHDNPPKFLSTFALLLCTLAFPLLTHAQPPQPPQDPSVLNSLDSLKRVITRRILSEAEKKDIRACDREKSQYLKQCRNNDSTGAKVDQQLTEAKKSGADLNDPAIQALLERKFALEKACDDAFTATARGKQCLAGEGKRRDALEKALKKDKQYQALLKKSEVPGSETL
ncbi:MAG: hypothetical protein JWO30_145, partial [Fibrobacteres bacterium]|nr:hypothetical protein [Fibrobacterota bacterium]